MRRETLEVASTFMCHLLGPRLPEIGAVPGSFIKVRKNNSQRGTLSREELWVILGQFQLLAKLFSCA